MAEELPVAPLSGTTPPSSKMMVPEKISLARSLGDIKDALARNVGNDELIAYIDALLLRAAGKREALPNLKAPDAKAFSSYKDRVRGSTPRFDPPPLIDPKMPRFGNLLSGGNDAE